MDTRVKLHPLHSAKMITEYMQAYGEYFPASRGTGRSTISLLFGLATAIENPHSIVQITDHHEAMTLEGYRQYEATLRKMIRSLGLEHLSTRVHRAGSSIAGRKEIENIKNVNSLMLCFGSPPQFGGWLGV